LILIQIDESVHLLSQDNIALALAAIE